MFPAADSRWICDGVIVENFHKKVQRADLSAAGFCSCMLRGGRNHSSVLLCRALIASLPENCILNTAI